MYEKIFDLPAHALVVHAVVVLLPMAALGGVAVAFVPALRRRFGVLVGLLTAAAVGAVPLATRTGDKLQVALAQRAGPEDARETELIARHRDIGEDLLPWALVLLVGVALVVLPPLMSGRRHRAPVPWLRWVVWAGAAATLVGAVLSTIIVIRAGHAGSSAVFEKLDRPAAIAADGT